MGQPLETVKIAWANDSGYLTINKQDFDPEKDTLFGSVEEAPEPEPEPDPPVVQIPALDLINTATEPDELTPLPTIGKVSAEIILVARPAGGYKRLEDIAAVEGLSRVDWGAVEAWR